MNVRIKRISPSGAFYAGCILFCTLGMFVIIGMVTLSIGASMLTTGVGFFAIRIESLVMAGILDLVATALGGIACAFAAIFFNIAAAVFKFGITLKLQRLNDQSQ